MKLGLVAAAVAVLAVIGGAPLVSSTLQAGGDTADLGAAPGQVLTQDSATAVDGAPDWRLGPPPWAIEPSARQDVSHDARRQAHRSRMAYAACRAAGHDHCVRPRRPVGPISPRRRSQVSPDGRPGFTR